MRPLLRVFSELLGAVVASMSLMPSCFVLLKTVIVPLHLVDPYCVHCLLITHLVVGAIVLALGIGACVPVSRRFHLIPNLGIISFWNFPFQSSYFQSMVDPGKWQKKKKKIVGKSGDPWVSQMHTAGAIFFFCWLLGLGSSGWFQWLPASLSEGFVDIRGDHLSQYWNK